MKSFKNSPILLCSLLVLNVACKAHFEEGFADGKAEGYSIGYDDGYGDGDSVGYDRGFAEGEVYFTSAGYPEGYNDGKEDGLVIGYNSGYTAGYNSTYNTGYTNGYNASYNPGYNAGLGDGYDMGYDDGYDDGYSDGYDDAFPLWEQQYYYNLGHSSGYNHGYDDGYDDGWFDGEDSGFNSGYNTGYDHGYDDGWDDGYDIGFNDGWDYGLSLSIKNYVGKINTNQMVGGAKILALAHNTLFNYKAIATPKQTNRGIEVKGKLIFEETSQTKKDLEKRAVAVEKYLILEMAKQLHSRFQLSQERSLKLAIVSNHFRKQSSIRAISAKEADLYASEAIGVGFQEMSKAYKESLKGETSTLKEVISKAAEKNATSPEQMNQVMIGLFF